MITVPMEFFWLILAALALVGCLIIASAFITGWLVYRAKRESHEPLSPKKVETSEKAVNLDEFAHEEKEVEISEAQRQQFTRFHQQFGIDHLKEEK